MKKDWKKIAIKAFANSEKAEKINDELLILHNELQNRLDKADILIKEMLTYFDNLVITTDFLAKHKDLIKEAQKYIFQKESQRNRAKKERTDNLQKIIIFAVKEKKDITAEQLLKHLESLVGNGIIESIVDGMIEWTGKNNKAESTPISALPSRLSRARKKI